MELFDEIKQEVKSRDSRKYDAWRAYGFELDGTFVSMGPNLEEIVESLGDEDEEDIEPEDLSEHLDEDVLTAYNQAIDEGNEDVTQFILDMDVAEFTIVYYRGRNFYYGPAVQCDSIQDVIGYTKVGLAYDNLGKGYIVYPKLGLEKDIKKDEKED